MTQLKPEPQADRATIARAADRSRENHGRGRGRGRGKSMGVAAVALVIAAVVTARMAGVGPSPLWWPSAIVAVITVVYLAASLFKLLMTCVGSAAGPGLGAEPGAPDERQEVRLPHYTVLVPLVGPDVGGRMTASLIADLSTLDYPTTRLEVLLLAGLGRENLTDALPDHFRVVSVGQATRAEAYAAGLAVASGDLCVGYEPGKRPDRGQLRAAASVFGRLPVWVVGLRPQTRCENADANWLTRCIAAENAVSSALLLRGLDKFGLVIPVDGASAHFRTDALRQLGAWGEGDPFATADLGIRIARRGWSVRMLNSVTAERVDDRFSPWLRRRTAALREGNLMWLAHTGSPFRLYRDLGLARFSGLQLTAAVSAFTALANPLFWLLAVALLAGGSDRVFPLTELSAVVAAMVLGNLLTAYSLMIGCMEQGRFHALRTLFIAPVFWALTSAAVYRALLRPGREVPAHRVAAASPRPEVV